MANMDEINLDVDEIRSSVSRVILNINDSEGNYSDEWLTTDCIGSAFQSVNSILDDFELAKSALLNHLEQLDAISAEAASKLSMLNDIISKFPSRRNSSTATVSNDITSLCVRKGPGMDNSVVGYVGKGAIVNIVGKSANNGWTEVLLEDGTQGYIATKFLNINTNSSEEQAASVTAEGFSPDIGATSLDSVVSETQSETSTPEPISSELDITAFVNTQLHNLNVRKNPGIDQPITGSAIKGTTLKVLEEDKGNGWTKVELEDGTVGYVSTKYLRINKNEVPKQEPDVAIDIKDPVALESMGQDTVSQEPNITAYVNTKSSGLNVRVGKGTDTAIKASVAKGTILNVLEKDDGSGWTKVRLGDGTTGYVSSAYLNMNSSSGISYNGTAVVDTSAIALNLRSSANGDIMTTIPGGTKIEIGESVNGWTRVKYDGREGYVATKWLSDINNGEV